jgi:Uma2 family endonuclease
MSTALRKPRMSRAEFFDWAEAQEVRHEFDGFQPVAMTGGSVDHNRICQNLYAALRSRLRGSGCEPLGPDAGIATVGDAVRYPDALATCTRVAGRAREVPDPVVVFEVLSASSVHTDQIVKLLEYRAVASIRRYVIVESDHIGLAVHSRAAAGADWTTTALTAGVLALPELAIELPVAEVYEGTDMDDGSDEARPA